MRSMGGSKRAREGDTETETEGEAEGEGTSASALARVQAGKRDWRGGTVRPTPRRFLRAMVYSPGPLWAGEGPRRV
jgi:hypothetical protein